MKVIEFYNQGAQVVIESPAVDMTHAFTASGTGETIQVGYEPKSNSKVVEGPAHDIIEHEGSRRLALKGGHVYSVTIVKGEDDIEAHVISAEHGHLLLPLPKDALVEVVEYDPEAQPAEGDGAEPQPEEQPEGEGMLGDESGDEAAGTE